MIRKLTKKEEKKLEEYGLDETVTQRIRDVWEQSTSSVLIPMHLHVIAKKRISIFVSYIILILLFRLYLDDATNTPFYLQAIVLAIMALSTFSLPRIDKLWRHNVALSLSPDGMEIFSDVTTKWKVITLIRNICIGFLLYRTGDRILYLFWGVHTLVWITAFHHMAKATGCSLLGDNDKQIAWLKNYCYKDPRLDEQ
jgi:hypothetical protein